MARYSAFGVDAGASASVPSPQINIIADGNGPIVVPDPALLFRADFEREGSDLLLLNADGADVRILDYFSFEPADVVTAQGGKLTGALVERLAGPQAPGQIAQLEGAAQDLPIGQVEQIEGVARAQRADGTQVILELGVQVYQGDVISTDEDGTVSITFVDESQFTMTANARMVLDELIYSPDGEDNSAVFNLVEGGFVFVAGQVARTGEMEVETPSATLGFRGTTVLVDLTTVLGVATVAVTLREDFDTLEAGIIELRDLNGNLITTITSTDSTWVVPLGGTPREVARTAADDADDAALLADAAAAFTSVVNRLEAGELPVNLIETGNGDSAPKNALSIDEPSAVDEDGDDDPAPPEQGGVTDEGEVEREGVIDVAPEEDAVDLPASVALSVGASASGNLDEIALISQQGANATGSLNITFGDNGADAGTDGQFQDTPTGANSSNRSVVFSSTVTQANSGITSGGEALVYALSQDDTTLTATTAQSGSTVFTLRLFDDDDGSYAFTLFQQLDHASAAIDFAFDFVASDAAQATQNGSISVVVNESHPIANDVALVGNVTGNSSFEDGFTGWTIDDGPSAGPAGETFATNAYSQSVSINTGGTIIPGDNSVADISFSGTLNSAFFGNNDGPGANDGIGTAFGPSLTSDPFTAVAGDTVLFEYKVFGGTGSGAGDDALVTAELVNTQTNDRTLVFSDQTSLNQDSGVLTLEVPITTAGEYEIVFKVGSFDGTDGGVIGARIAIGTAGIVRGQVLEGVIQTFDADQFIDAATDLDEDPTLSLVSVSATSALGASVSIDSSGNVTYDPTGSATIVALGDGEQATDTFTFTIADQNGVQSSATANITVVGVANATTAKTGTDPIVLDLDGDGVELIAPQVAFDMDADGQQEEIGWVAADDGLLVVDTDGSGAIEDGSELFSEVFEGGSYANSIEALRSLDSNNDGTLNADDDRFGEILVWQDADGDGRSDEGELKTLEEHGIVSIGLDVDEANTAQSGNLIFAEGAFTTSDGQTGSYVGVTFGTASPDYQLGEESLPVLSDDALAEPSGAEPLEDQELPLIALEEPVGTTQTSLADQVEAFLQDEGASAGQQSDEDVPLAGPADEGQAFLGNGEGAGFLVPPADDVAAYDAVPIA